MNAADLFAPDWISLWATGATLTILALVLFFLDVANKAQRAFALLLGLRGLTFFFGPLRAEAETVRGSVFWANLAPYAILPLVPLVVYFLSVYPVRRGLGRRPWGTWLLFTATAAILGWYMADHSAYAQVTAGTPARYADYGPLYVLNSLTLPAFAFAGLWLVGAYRRRPDGSVGFSLFLMVAAFTLNGLFDGMLALLDFVQAGPERFALPWAWATWWLPVTALPISLLACWQLLPILRKARHQADLQEVTRFFAFAVPVALVSPFVYVLPTPQAEDVATFMLGVWRLAIPLLLAYALMRYQLFDIDLRLKDGVRRGVILGGFTFTFFLVSEAAESLLQGDRGPVFGMVAAGVLALASRPLQGFASRASDQLMPDTKPIAQQTYGERLRFYLDQYHLISQDGHVTTKERNMLDRLQRTLALAPQVTQQLERTGALPRDVDLAALPTQDEVAQSRDSRLEMAVKGTLAASALALVFGMLSQGIESVIPLSNQVAGLIAAAVVALSLGPIEDLADRLTHRLDPSKATDAKDEAERRQAFRAALATALEDGSLSERDLHYLAGLQKRLRIPWATRWRMERQVRRNIGL